jgi:hypothetical protein
MEVNGMTLGTYPTLSTDSNNVFRYSSFVRVGSGLKFEEYERITKMPSWKPRGPNGLPDWLQTTKQNGKWTRDDDKWDMYLDPEE